MPSNYYSSRFFSPNPTVALRDANIFILTIVSATNLPNCGRLSGGRMKVHAEVSLDGGPTKKSGYNCDGETNPTWNFPVKFPLTESTHQTGGDLVVNLYMKISVGHKFIGAFKIKVESLFERSIGSDKVETVRVEGTLNGRLKISYGFGISGKGFLHHLIRVHDQYLNYDL